MSATLVQLLLILAQQVGGALFMVWFFRWRLREKKQEEVPSNKDLQDFKEAVERWQEESKKEYRILFKDVVGLRESVAKINGRLNGHEWKRG